MNQPVRSGGTRTRVAPFRAVTAVLVGLLFAMSAGFALGCSPSGAQSTTTVLESQSVPAVDGQSAPAGFHAVTLIVTRPDGTVEHLCVWLADTPTLRDRGLMGVTDPDMGGKAGMAFRFGSDTEAKFWMKDTLLPLSIAWFAADGAFVSSASMEPCPADSDSCPTYGATGSYRMALETAQGRLPDLGLVPGSRVKFGDSC